jgi:cytidine deaminase
MSSEVSTESSDIKDLYKMALLVREKSYSPYSGHKVGAAIRTSDGKIYTGCNIENSSFGATVCAERVAIQKAISEQGPLEITEVMVVTKASPPWPPCGMCRQVIGEFGKDAIIYTSNLEGVLEKFTLNDIFPLAFTSSHLK